MRDFELTQKIIKKHNKAYKSICLITFILFFPFAILQILNEVSEKLLYYIAILRNKIIKYFMQFICYMNKETKEDKL